MKSTKPKTKAKKKDVIGADELDAKNGKFRVTMFIDLDLLDEIRKRAGDKRLPYQTYINQLLREQVLGSDETERIRKIVREELSKEAI
jgi:predicted DNA binding CopG/RHH family protein